MKIDIQDIVKDDESIENFLNLLEKKEISIEEEETVRLLLALVLNPMNFILANRYLNYCVNIPSERIKKVCLMSVSHVSRVYAHKVTGEIWDFFLKTFKDTSDPLHGYALDTAEDLEIFLGKDYMNL